MRFIIVLLLFALLIGCDRRTLQTVETVPSTAGGDRLIRKEWVTVPYSQPDQMSYDSHSLVWQRLDNGAWTDYLSISQADFQRGCACRRWISSIHSFDPVSAVAVLKIAEGDAPEESGAISYIYSWREWDMKNNREIKTIRVCDDPFESYDKPKLP